MYSQYFGFTKLLLLHFKLCKSDDWGQSNGYFSVTLQYMATYHIIAHMWLNLKLFFFKILQENSLIIINYLCLQANKIYFREIWTILSLLLDTHTPSRAPMQALKVAVRGNVNPWLPKRLIFVLIIKIRGQIISTFPQLS